MDTPAGQHTAGHTAKTPHVMHWGIVKANAEESVKHILEGGNTPRTLHDVIGKDRFESPEDWDELIDYCKWHNVVCRDMNKLYRAQTSWIQAMHELEYASHYAT